MPEGIEVYIIAKYLNAHLKNKKLTDITFISGRYVKKPLPNLDLLSTNPTIKRVRSKGKFMWFELSNNTTNTTNTYIFNTFGLTGLWSFTKSKNNTDRIIFHINNTQKLYFSDARNFGTMKITNDVNVLTKKLKSLGPDLLKTSFTDNEFHNRLYKFIKKKDKQIVKVLMNQTSSGGVGSGIGNYLVAEILYHAKISPHTMVKTIYNNKQLSDNLSKSIKYIIKLSYLTTHSGYIENFDNHLMNWLNRRRLRDHQTHQPHPDINIGDNIFEFKVYRQKKDPLGNKIKVDKIITGRSTYWSPKVQE